MPDLALALATALLSALKSHRDLVFENLALRHQLAVLATSDRRPRFRPADRGGVPLGYGTPLPASRSRCGVRLRFPPSRGRTRHHRGAHRSQVTLAESVHRAPDRLRTAGVSRSHYCAEREASPPHPRPVLRLLPPNSNPPESRQGLAKAAPSPAAVGRRDRRAA